MLGKRGPWVWWRAAAAGAVLGLLTACGSGGGADMGEVVIGLTDADGDFATYQVDVTSLTLTRDDGAVVEVVPRSTRLDFARYTELSEFFTVASVPQGVYTALQLRLDYRTADVRVEVNGAALPVAVRGTDGLALETASVTVELKNRNALHLTRDVPSHLLLDFDLAASHQVDLTDPAAPVVVVRPVLLARVNPEIAHRHRLRGQLKDAASGHQFQVRVLPFLRQKGEFGVFPVQTGADTRFEVDGVTYLGAPGSKALATLAPGAPVEVYGLVNRAGRHLRADLVLAGSSVPWADRDALGGTVVARSGDTLTLRGAAITLRDGTATYAETAVVTLGPDTRVTREDALTIGPSGSALGRGAISVGQRLAVLGNFTPPPAPGAAATLDATAGHARLLVTTVSGPVTAVDGRGLVLGVRSLAGYRPAAFDFAGTGGSATQNADPGAYEVDASGMVLNWVNAGDAVQVRGFVAPFGAAAPDFVARSVFRPALAPATTATLRVLWQPATSQPFLAMDAAGMALNLNGAPNVRTIYLNGQALQLGVAEAPRLDVALNGDGAFALVKNGVVTSFDNYEPFVLALAQQMVAGAGVDSLTAHGEWDATTATLVVTGLSVVLGGAQAQ
ncbi:MAG: hypothetical protein OEW11_09830 [Nitrospirota bacterium]|nr:hypothetical protein [Nitrospirota bacterium]